MSQDNSNSILEMGTSDQVLVATKKKKNLIWIAGGIAMVIVIAVVITLVVVLTGNESDADDVTTTEGTTSPITITPTIPPTIIPTTEATTPAPEPPDTTPEQPEPTTPVPTTPVPTTPVPSTTEEPEPTTTAPPLPDDSILLEDILTGVFSPPTFNGTWTGENEVLFRGTYGDLVIYNVDTNQSRVLIDNSSTILQQSARFLQLSPDGQQVVLAHNVAPVYRHSFLARYTAINLETDAPTDIVPPGVPANDAYLQNFVWGPTGTALAFVYRNNVYYQASLTATPVQITTTGVDDILYHGIPDWVYEEEVFGSNSALWFSADGSKLAYGSFDDTNVRIMKVPHYGVPGSLEYQYTQHHEIRYPKPGTTNPTVSVTLLDIESDVRTVYTVPTDLEQPILRAVSFVSNDVAIMWANRVQNEVKVELCNQLSVICNEIFTHSEPDGWIDNIPLIFNTAGNSFVTILPQAVNGVLYKQIVQATAGTVGASWTVQDRTNTAHTVGEILLWTADDVIWYKATHERDSAEQHVYTVTADRVVSCFTCDIVREDGGECLYNDAAINREATRITVNCAGPSIPQIYVVDNSANIISTLHGNHEVAELLTERALPPIIRLSVPVATGFPDADVHIQVPADYQLRTNVPLLVYVYGGPDTSLVTKQWNIDWGTSLVTRWNIAVAHIDGRGSGLRGVANTFALNRHLGGAEVDDQISVTRYLHENLSWVDSNRTCIWGWSYGGYAASLALARGGDVFRCAAAVAPVVDWRFYDTIYTERYMDLPTNNVEGYAQSSLLTDDVVEAYRDKRYFLVHGTADDNVHYQHAMVFSRLLQRRDVYFTQMSYTDEDHGLVGVRPHLYHGLEKFLQDNML